MLIFVQTKEADFVHLWDLRNQGEAKQGQRVDDKMDTVIVCVETGHHEPGMEKK